MLSALVLVPLILPPFVGAIGLHHLLGKFGALNTLLMDMGWITEGYDFIGNGGFCGVGFFLVLCPVPLLYFYATGGHAKIRRAAGGGRG